jgi:hypothetical protein
MQSKLKALAMLSLNSGETVKYNATHLLHAIIAQAFAIDQTDRQKRTTNQFAQPH